MTDLEKLLSIIEGKVEFTKEVANRVAFPNAVTDITIQNSNNPTLGYSGFHSEWLFDMDGNFVAVGHWEV